MPAARAKWSIGRRLAQGLVLAALVPVLLFGAVLLHSQWRRDHDDLWLRLDANARLSANAMDAYLETQLAAVTLLSRQASVDPEADLEHLLHAFPSMLRAMWVDSHGRVEAVRDVRGRLVPLAAKQVANEDWFKGVVAQQAPRISDAYRGRIYDNEILVAVAAPVMLGGELRGLLQAAIPVQSFAQMNSDSLTRRNLEMLLLDRTGRVVFVSPGVRWGLLDATGEVGRQLQASALPADKKSRIVLRDGLLRSGDPAYVAAVAMRNGWTLALMSSRAALRAPMLRSAAVLLVLLVLTSLGVLAALWQQRVLLRGSIGYLLGSLRGFALGGRLDPATELEMPVELQPMADAIGDLGTRMNAAYDELQKVLEDREQVINERTRSLHQAVSELDRLSRTDGLTGCLNYRGFQEAGNLLWQASNAAEQPLSALALDIDFFKRYNDHYGHVAGDGALRRFAGAVRSALLRADDVLARPGGEEFTVFLPGSNHEQAMRVAERVCQRVRDADIRHAESAFGRLTVSIGVATRIDTDVDLKAMLERADEALYRAKQAGRNRAHD